MPDDGADRSYVTSAEGEDVPPEGFGRRPVLATTVVCACFGSLGHAVLWLGAAQGWVDQQIFWQPVVGIALVVVGVTAFGGFYLAARRARVAIAASFLLTFLVSLSYLLTIQALADAADRGAARDLFDDFRAVVVSIVAFYFGTETIVSVAKVWGFSRAKFAHVDPAEFRRIDRDLPRITARRGSGGRPAGVTTPPPEAWPAPAD